MSIRPLFSLTLVVALAVLAFGVSLIGSPMRVEAQGTSCPEQIPFGEIIQCSIEFPAQKTTHKFEGVSGDQITVRMMGTSNELNAVFSVFSPSGSKVASRGAYIGNTAEQSLQLGESGEYSLLAGDSGSDATGTFNLFVQRTNNPGQASAFALGSPLSGSLVPAEMDSYTFQGQVDGNILINMAELTTELDPEFRIYRPDGTITCSSWNYSMIEVLCPLDADGVYLVLVGDQGGNVSGDYSLYIQCLNDKCSSQDASAAPLAQSQNAVVDQNSQVDVTFIATDADTCELTFNIVDLPTYGTLGVIADEPCVNGSPNTDKAKVTFTLNSGFATEDSFSFKVSDGVNESVPAAVSVIINSSSTEPILLVEPSDVVPGDALTVTWSDIGSPASTDWISLYKVGASNNSHGAWSYTGGLASGNLEFINPNEEGNYEFRYLLSGSFTSIVTSNAITVRAVTNTDPLAYDQSVDTDQDMSIDVVLSGQDYEQCELAITIESGPSNGVLNALTNTLCSAGSPNSDAANVTYTPVQAFVGVDKFTFLVEDNEGGTARGSVTINVNGLGEVKAELSSTKLVASPGETISLLVSIDPVGHGVSAAEFDVMYNHDDFQALSVEPGDLLGADPLVGFEEQDMTVVGQPSSGIVRMALSRQGSTSLPTPPGVLAEVKFIISESAGIGIHEFSLVSLMASDEAPQALGVLLNNSIVEIEIKPKLAGDANGDCSINFLDLAILGAAYGLVLGDSGFNSRADFNSDGSVNHLDLAILGAGYGKTCPD